MASPSELLIGAGAVRDAGRSRSYVIAHCVLTTLVLALAVLEGRFALASAADETQSVILAFAGGAVLAALADPLVLEAFEHGRPLNSFATAGGFFLAFIPAPA